MARQTQDELRELRGHLAERLHALKSLLARTGRSGGWSSYLREARIPRSTADRLVARHEAALGPPEEKCLSGAISGPTEEDVHRLFQRLLSQLRKVITTQAAAFHFVSDMLLQLPGIDGDFPDSGVEIYRGRKEPSPIPTVQNSDIQAQPMVA